MIQRKKKRFIIDTILQATVVVDTCEPQSPSSSSMVIAAFRYREGTIYNDDRR